MEAKDTAKKARRRNVQDITSLEGFYDGKKAGIKEVVEWIEAQRISGFTIIEGVGAGIPISEEKWQAKLKEWGVLAP